MTLLIDPPVWPAHGRLWSHLASDVSFEELHAFAALIGLDPRMFEGDHYDVPEEHYRQVLAAGAEAVTGRELLTRLRCAGLRRRKRKGERVLAGRVVRPGVREDAVLSRLVPPSPVVGWCLVVVQEGRVLVHDRGGRVDLPRTTSRPAPPEAFFPFGFLRLVMEEDHRVLRVEAVLSARSDARASMGPTVEGAIWLGLDDAAAAIASPVAALLEHLARYAPAGPR